MADGGFVEVYPNTRFAGKAAAVLDTPWVARLRAAGVSLTLLSGPTVKVPGRWTDPDKITRQSSEAGYLELLGEEANMLTLAELSARTGLTVKLLSHARQELERN